MRKLAKVNQRVEVRDLLKEFLLEREIEAQERMNFKRYIAKEVK